MVRLLTYALAIFFAALHSFITAYINSTVALSEGGEHGMLLTFLGASLVALVGFYTAPKLLSSIGNRRFMLLWALIDVLALVFLALSPLSGPLLLAALGLHMAAAPLIGYSLDLFFEQSVPEGGVTGISRGVFLTSGNVALVLSPLLSGLVLGSMGAYMIYGLSAASLLVFLIVIFAITRRFADPAYLPVTLAHMGRVLVGPLGPVLASHFSLRVFYGWAPVYFPLYLTLTLGFSWEEAGAILAIALLPFALFELPLGTLEDRYFGEREVLAIGFLILACSVAALWFVPSHTFLSIAAIMFMTRVGAAFVEIATETNFFREVRAEHADAIVLFRMMGPLGWLVGVGIAALSIALAPMPYAFGILGAVALIGIIPAMRIHDAK